MEKRRQGDLETWGIPQAEQVGEREKAEDRNEKSEMRNKK
jgi:hypothetical protein